MSDTYCGGKTLNGEVCQWVRWDGDTWTTRTGPLTRITWKRYYGPYCGLCGTRLLPGGKTEHPPEDAENMDAFHHQFQEADGDVRQDLYDRFIEELGCSQGDIRSALNAALKEAPDA